VTVTPEWCYIHRVKTLAPLLILLGLLLFFQSIGSRDFWAPDEGDFAQIVRELDGDLLVPRLNGEPYAEKPPFFYYATYASKRVLFWLKDETSLRVPSALSALLCLLLFGWTISRFFDRRHGFLASMVLLCSPLFYWQARYLQVDMLFSAFVVASLLSFFWSHQTGNRRLLYLFFLFLALAFTTKGPLSIILVVPVVILYLFYRKEFGLAKAKELYIGALLLLLIILPWYVGVYMREGWSFLHENIIQQNFVRFFDAWSHRRPVYYYLTTLPLDFFPWTVFLPMGFLLAVRKRSDNPGIVFFLIWFVWMFFFFSLSSGKISKYMLPALPPIALAASFSLAAFDTKYNRWALALLAVLFGAMGLLLLFYRPGMFPPLLRERIVLGLLAIILSILLVVSLARRNMRAGTVVLFSGVILFLVSANTLAYGKWNTYKSPRPVGEMIRELTSAGTPWVFYGSMRGVYVYYAGKKAVAVDEHEVARLAGLKERLPEFFLLFRNRDTKEVEEALGPVERLFERKIGDTDMVIAHFKK
jgi:4-amino-4-deoxy-L-arabinose transferase-like glycosyltransferase